MAKRYRVTMGALAAVSLSTLVAWLPGCGESPIGAPSAGASGAATGGQPATSGTGSVNAGSAGQGSALGGVGAVGGSAGSAAGQSQAGMPSGDPPGGGAGGASAAGSAGAAGAGGAGGAPNGTEKITVWLAGDSTMADGNNTCPVGWGKQFQTHFNENARVVNSAVGGTTVRSWLYNVTSTLGAEGDCVLGGSAPQARWTTMVNEMKKGDYLFIQFGINDTTSASCPKHVSIETFKMLFGMMAQTAKDKGVQPVFLTAVSSIACDGSVAKGTRGGFATATKDAALQYGVPVIDLEQLSVALYTSLGFCPSTDTTATFTAATPIGNFFCKDHTHFEAAGAKQIGDLVAKAIRDQGLGLASHLLP